MTKLYHVGEIIKKRRLLHVGNENVANLLQQRFPDAQRYRISADISNSREMRDSGRAHYPSLIAEDCGLHENVALYLKRNGEDENDLITVLEKLGFKSIHYINTKEGEGNDSWIVWNWEIV